MTRSNTLTSPDHPATPVAAPSAVFPRNVARPAAIEAVGGEGAWLIDRAGRRHLDAAGGAFVAILGHSPTPVADTLARAARQLNFAYSGDFTTSAQERFARRLTALAPPGLDRAVLTTSGSTANEAALKLARQYHLVKGEPQRTTVISREHSYHGSTIGALSMTGSMPRRRPFAPYLLDFPKVPAPNPYRSENPLDETGHALACADALERAIVTARPERVSAFIVEPVAGAPLGALVTPPAYLERVREICSRHGVLMIVDEVVSGLGRTGSWFGVEESGVVPDIITLGKGLGGGFLPAGAMLVHSRLHEAFERAGTSFVHSESFTGHVLLAEVGLAVLDFIEDNGLIDRIRADGSHLGEQMRALAGLPLVGDVRGRGFLHGIEIVADKVRRRPFPRALRMAERVAAACAERGVIVLAGNAAVDGTDGDTIVVAPPYVTTREELELIVATLREALVDVAASAPGA